MKLAIRLAFVALLIVRSASAEDLLIESCKEGKNFDKYKETGKGWFNSFQLGFSKSTAPGVTAGIGSRKITLPPPDEATARFTPRFKEAQKVFVYTTWPRGACAFPVHMVVRHAGGDTTKTVTQSGWGTNEPSNANVWVPLGQFEFKPGDDHYVEIVVPKDSSRAPNDKVNNPQAYADAVRFTDKELTEGVDKGAGAPPPPPAKPDIIVESRPEGMNFSQYKEVEGGWTNSGNDKGQGKSKAPGLSDATKVGTRKTMCTNLKHPNDNKPHDEPAAARFMPMIEGPAHYYVYVTWPREANAQPVTYTIKHAKGETKKTLVQDGWGKGPTGANGNIWVSLGDYDFQAGEDQWVEVRDTGADVKVIDDVNICQIYADSVRFTTTPLKDDGTAGASPSLSAPASPTVVPGRSDTPPVQTGGLTSKPVEWVTDLRKAQETAASQNRKILVFFSSAESAASKHFESKVFADPAVNTLMRAQYVPVKIDFDANSELAYQLHIFKAGTIVIYSSAGQPLKKITDRLSPSEMVSELQ